MSGSAFHSLKQREMVVLPKTFAYQAQDIDSGRKIIHSALARRAHGSCKALKFVWLSLCGDITEAAIERARYAHASKLHATKKAAEFWGPRSIFRQARCLGAEEVFRKEVHMDSSGSKIMHTGEMQTFPCLRVNRTISSGETVEHSGAIIVKGNVNRGAVVRADGDIIVMGHLEGEAHAGRSGDMLAVIFAFQLKHTAISIAGCVACGLISDTPHFGEVVSLASSGEIRIQKADVQSFKGSSAADGNIKAVKEQRVGVLKSKDKAWFPVDVRSIRKPSQVAFLTGAYIFVIGVALLLFPVTLFGIVFELKSIRVEWIRVGALLAVVFGVYYLGTAYGDAKGYNGADSFYMSTVIGRIFLFISFCWLVAGGAAPLPLFFVGAVNFIGALTMLKALLSQKQPHANA